MAVACRKRPHLAPCPAQPERPSRRDCEIECNGGGPMAMRRSRTLAGSTLAILLIGALVVTGMPAGAQQPRQGGGLIFPVPSDPPSYDGHREETFGLIHPFAPFYSTLLRVDPTDPSGTKPVGDLAESWTVAKDGLTYTFKLRKGVKFHDGHELTAKDVKASYDKIIFPPQGVGSSRKGQYSPVEAVEAPGPHVWGV